MHKSSYFKKLLSTRMGVASHVTNNLEHADFYQHVLKADLEVVKWVKYGYKLNLTKWPESSFLKNNKTSLKDPTFVWNEIRKLCKLGVILEVKEKPHVVNTLSVVFSNKNRLVWYARELNKLIATARLPLKLLDFYGGTSDLEAGYFQVGIAEEQKQLLGCALKLVIWPTS